MDKTKKTILVVEDDPSQRKALVTKLDLEGFNTLEAENGEEGLSIVLKNHPDLILLDYMMPKMDGPTMFTELCRDKWGMGVPVLMLTNLSDSKHIVENIRDGVTDYLVKSEYKISDVINKVKEHLD